MVAALNSAAQTSPAGHILTCPRAPSQAGTGTLSNKSMLGIVIISGSATAGKYFQASIGKSFIWPSDQFSHCSTTLSMLTCSINCFPWVNVININWVNF